jgi:hypothetical protein
MSDEEKPIRRRIGVLSAPLPRWEGRISAPIEKAAAILDGWMTGGDIAEVQSTPDNGYQYDISNKYPKGYSFTLFLTPDGETTRIHMEKQPGRPHTYISKMASIFERFERFKLPITTDAPMVYEDDPVLRPEDPIAQIEAELQRRGGPTLVRDKPMPPEPAQPAKMRARDVIAEYKKRKRREKLLTLKQFCAELGVNYESIRAAKSRYEKPKRRGKKR